MKRVLPVLLIALAIRVSAQPAPQPKPLTYEESRAANRPPTAAAGKAIVDWTASVATQLAIIIGPGVGDPQMIRDMVLQNVRAEEMQLRASLKDAGWTEQQVNATLNRLTERHLSIPSIADQLTQWKK